MINGGFAFNWITMMPSMLKQTITISKKVRMSDILNPIHPDEVLLEELLKPMNLSQNRLAIDIGLDARRINEIVQGARSVTANTALRLAR